MTDNQLFCKECGCGEDHHLIIQRLRELHYPTTDDGCSDPECCSPYDSIPYCNICGGYDYPCETIKILNGGN